MLWPPKDTLAPPKAEGSSRRGSKRARRLGPAAPLGYVAGGDLVRSHHAGGRASHSAPSSARDQRLMWAPPPILPSPCSPPAFLLHAAGSCILAVNQHLAVAAAKYWAAGGPQARQEAARRAGVALYSRVGLLKLPPKKDAEGGSAPRFFLQLQGGDKEPASAYRAGDLWALSTSRRLDGSEADCLAQPGQGSRGARVTRQRLACVLRSVYHGVSGRDMVQVVPLTPDPVHALPALGSGVVEARVCAVRVPAPTSLVDALRAVSSALDGAAGQEGARPPPPIVGALADPAAPAPPLPPGKPGGLTSPGQLVSNLVEAAHARTRLNPQQVAVLRQVLHWMAADAPHGVATVHGVFGAGKSHTLVATMQAAVALASALQWPAQEPFRILVAAGTNVAVDRLLLGLRGAGFTSFARVGSAKAVHPDILPHMLHHTDSEGSLAAAQRELTGLLNGAQGTHGEDGSGMVKAVRAALGALASVETRMALASAPIIGTTIASATSPALHCAGPFQLVVLDEASQVPYAGALLPLLKARARWAVLVGDPLQLPPPTPDLPAGLPPSSCDTLFEALVRRGGTCLPMTEQYRCHPLLAALASRLFYDAKVTSGIPSDQRPPILPDSGPLLVLDTEACPGAASTRASGGGGSLVNEGEATAVARAVEELLVHGLEPGDVGVIATYRRQVAAIRSRLASLATAADAAAKSLAGHAPPHPTAAALHQRMLQGSRLLQRAAAVQVATVDAFQGNEREVVVFSATHTGSAAAAAAFVDEPRRTNVALTRAKRTFVLVGSMSTIGRCPHWGRVVEDARQRPGAVLPSPAAVLARLPPTRSLIARLRMTLSGRPHTALFPGLFQPPAIAPRPCSATPPASHQAEAGQPAAPPAADDAVFLASTQ